VANEVVELSRIASALKDLRVKLSLPIAIGILCLPFFVATPVPSAFTAGDEQSLLQADHAAFESDSPSPVLNDSLLDNNFTWTDSSGNT
jgi:hypothetical protein